MYNLRLLDICGSEWGALASTPWCAKRLARPYGALSLSTHQKQRASTAYGKLRLPRAKRPVNNADCLLLFGFDENLRFDDIRLGQPRKWRISFQGAVNTTISNRSKIMMKQSALVFAILTSTTFTVVPGSAATFVVDKTFWGNTTTTGSFAWAMHQAEITPGYDLIDLTTNVNIGDYQSSPLPFRLANITDPAGLLIQGNGHSLTGDPAFISQSGVVHTKINPRKYMQLLITS